MRHAASPSQNSLFDFMEFRSQDQHISMNPASLGCKVPRVVLGFWALVTPAQGSSWRPCLH
jgi:hypothetical protein